MYVTMFYTAVIYILIHNYVLLDTSPSKSSEDNNLPVIGAASGAGLFALLVILFGGVLCIVVMMHHKNKENKKESPPMIYSNTSLTEANKVIEHIYTHHIFLLHLQ